jgi:hypothetical protein
MGLFIPVVAGQDINSACARYNIRNCIMDCIFVGYIMNTGQHPFLPAFSQSFFVSSIDTPGRSAGTTVAPCVAKATEMACPSPVAAPVTMATFPFN